MSRILPTLTPVNSRYNRAGDSEHFSDDSLSENTIEVVNSRGFYRRNFMRRVILPSANSSFLKRVLDVLFARPKKQMIRVAARRIIAFMTHEKAIVDFPKNKSVAYAMGQHAKANSFSSDVDFSITPRAFTPVPSPTAVSHNHILPECLFRRDFGFPLCLEKCLRNLNLHFNLWLTCRAPGKSSSAGAFLFLPLSTLMVNN